MPNDHDLGHPVGVTATVTNAAAADDDNFQVQ